MILYVSHYKLIEIYYKQCLTLSNVIAWERLGNRGNPG
jgi:hypothetical protein